VILPLFTLSRNTDDSTPTDSRYSRNYKHLLLTCILLIWCKQRILKTHVYQTAAHTRVYVGLYVSIFDSFIRQPPYIHISCCIILTCCSAHALSASLETLGPGGGPNICYYLQIFTGKPAPKPEVPESCIGLLAGCHVCLVCEN
jgi:hypothetical protein